MDQQLAAPLPVHPRLDPKPWGGHGLANFGFALPPVDPIGEALLTAAEAVVAEGPHEGRTLGELAAAAPDTIVGRAGLAVTGGRPIFPLLIKLIEATAHLSIQVHPDDQAARREHEHARGKTEAWHVLKAEPGAHLLLGLREDVEAKTFADAVRRGERVAGLMRAVPARVGETVLLPAGTVHALGGGTLVYEVQQPSDLTYRLDDWGRLDAEGRPRPVHVEAGLSVLDPASRPSPIRPTELRAAVGRRQLLVGSRFFAVERIALPAGGEAAIAATGSPQVVTCLAGAAGVATAAGSTIIGHGGTVVVPVMPGATRLAAQAPTVLLRAWVPTGPSE